MPLPIDVSKARGRLVTIDALRGIAALSIAVAHASGNVMMSLEHLESSWVNTLFYPFTVGIARVYLFFLISGFSIHLRWCKAKIKGGDTEKALEFLPFWKRRIKRLYPTFLIALFIYILLDFFLGKLVFDTFFIWNVISHVLMIHNLDARTVYSFNGQFWTLAIEEQLYLAYFLLIWLRVKYGWRMALTICGLARVGWFVMTSVIAVYGFKIPAVESSVGTWILWALGAVSVEYAFGIIKLPKWMSSFKIGVALLLPISAWYVYGLSNLVNTAGTLSRIWWLTAQPLWGIGFFFIINSVVALENRKLKNWQMSSLKTFAWFGVFSYSIYLMSEFTARILPDVHWTLRAIAGIFIAYVFHLLFERPFMNKKRKNLASVPDSTGQIKEAAAI